MKTVPQSSVCNYTNNNKKEIHISNIRIRNVIEINAKWYCKSTFNSEYVELNRGTIAKVIAINQKQFANYENNLPLQNSFQLDLLIELNNKSRYYVPSLICKKIENKWNKFLSK